MYYNLSYSLFDYYQHVYNTIGHGIKSNQSKYLKKPILLKKQQQQQQQQELITKVL
jgi:hypothetical protein